MSDLSLAEQNKQSLLTGINTQGFSTVAEPTKISGDEEFEALAPGTRFTGPDGKERVKPYKVEGDADYSEVPEGSQFIDPKGQLREKPKYEGVNYTANTLYNMAVNDQERQKALEFEYPGKVKPLPEGGFYVEDEGGVKRKPKGFTEAPGSFLTAQAAPVAGSVAGEIGGGLLGSVAGPVGTVGGAVAGGAGGGMVGQGFNDAILQLAGVYDRSGGEEALNIGLSGAAGGVGAGVGRAFAAVAPMLKGAVRNVLPRAAVDFLGAEPAGLSTAIGLREKGVPLVPPSMWAKEAPHVQNLVEVLDPAFRTQKPLLQAAEGHYEKSAGEILEQFGVKPSGSLLNPTAEVPTKEAGEKLLLKTRAESGAADARLQAALAERKAAAGAGAPANNEQVLADWQASRKAAESLIDAGFKDIETDIDKAMLISKAGHNGGELWQMVGNKLQGVRQGIVSRHNLWYKQADEAAGGHLPDSSGLAEKASDFLKQLPEEFKSKYPTVVQQLGKLGEGEQPTFGQLHNLRSVLRNNVNWLDMSSDLRNGTYKFFANRVDEVLHDPKAVPELQLASRLLDATDTSYGESMRVFNAKEIKAVMAGLESGEPADPKLLFDAIAREGHTDLTAKIMKMIGHNLASGVKAADVQSMLNASKTLAGTTDGNLFAREVLGRYRTGMLDAIHGSEMGGKLLKQAQNIAALEGKIDINVRAGDTAMDIIGKARMAAENAKKAAADPLIALNKSMKKIEREHQIETTRMQREQRSGPLGFLYHPDIQAMEAVDKILGSEDLILAAGAKFGEKSPEFNMLRQIYAQRVFERSFNLGDKLAKISPEVQNLMFPGTTLPQLQLLAKEMDFLTSSKAMATGAGKSIMATERVEHPWSSIPLGRGVGKIVPGVDAGGRFMLGKYYKFVTDLSNNLTLLRWIEKGLKGNEAAREMVRKEVQRAMQVGGAVGAGLGESQFAKPQQPQ